MREDENIMEEKNDSICIRLAESDEELCGRRGWRA